MRTFSLGVFHVRWFICAFALLVAGVGIGIWWQHTAPARTFRDMVLASSLDAETKEVLQKLAESPLVWDSSLIQHLSSPVGLKHLVWQGTTKSLEHGRLHVLIFDAFIRPVADTPIPPVCVICDDQRNLIAWAVVATYSAGFLQAALSDDGVLTITTVANWFFGKGTYRYAIKNRSIEPLDEGEFTKFDEQDQMDRLPKLLAPPRNL